MKTGRGSGSNMHWFRLSKIESYTLVNNDHKSRLNLAKKLSDLYLTTNLNLMRKRSFKIAIKSKLWTSIFHGLKAGSITS